MTHAMPETAAKRAPATRISLFVSDVDGTLVTPEKVLSPATVEAAHKLKAAGVALAIVSSRPPRGMVRQAAELGLELFAGFNGSSIVRPDLTVVEQTFVPEKAAAAAIEALRHHGADVWVFTDREWYVTNPDNPHVAREVRTVGFDPIVVESFEGTLERVGKIVGVSDDHDALAHEEGKLQALLGHSALAKRSQVYYLDVTPPHMDKGHAVKSFAAHFGVPLEEVAVIGDMANDLPMFATGHLAIAMGNALPDIQAKADFVTTSNKDDGFAHAVEEFILPRAAAR